MYTYIVLIFYIKFINVYMMLLDQTSKSCNNISDAYNLLVYLRNRKYADSATFIWATSWENLIMPYANNKGADQPVYPRSLISTFVVRCLGSKYLYISRQACVCRKAGRFESHVVANPKDRFSRDMTHMRHQLKALVGCAEGAGGTWCFWLS